MVTPSLGEGGAAVLYSTPVQHLYTAERSESLLLRNTCATAVKTSLRQGQRVSTS